MGFEPTWRSSRQNDFESFSLWPLRYVSVYVSPPFFSAFFRRKRALERTDGKNSKLIQFSNRVKPAWLQGFWWTKRTAPRKISSRARYDRFDTSPFRKYSVFGADNMISSQARKTASIRFCIFCFIYAEEQRSLDCQDILAKTKASVNTKIDKETVRW